MSYVAYSTREAWLEARRSGIGGSDVPAILGLSPYATPRSVWLSKVGLDEERESTYSQRRGAHMEAFIAKELEGEAGVSVTDVFGAEDYVIARHPVHPILAYSPDAFLLDPSGVHVLGEWKSNLRGGKAWDDEVPPHVAAQAQHGMFVLDFPAAYVAVDLGHDFRWARVERDPAYEAETVPRLLAWWDAYVETEEPPPLSGHEIERDVLARQYPAEAEGMVVGLPTDALDWHERIVAIREEKKRLDAEESALKAQMQDCIQDAEYGLLPGGMGAYSWRTVAKKPYVVTPKPYRELRWVKKVKEV